MKENLNPDFENNVILNYFFEKQQLIKFEAYDGDGLGSDELIGITETTLGTIVGAKQQTFTADLLIKGNTKSRGKLIARVDSVVESNMEVKMKIHAKNLPSNAGCLCGSDNIFFEIHRGSLADPELFLKVYGSDPIPNSHANAVYPLVKIKG